MDLIIGQEYWVEYYGRTPGKAKTTYTGKLQEQTETTNEVHGFSSDVGCYAVLKKDLNKRVKKL